MRVSVNLASRPFVELRPLFAKLRLAIGLLTLVSVGLMFWLHALNERTRIASIEMNQLKAQTAEYNAERARNEARMMQPQNKAVLDRSIFLNELFARKSFSWTATMMDLERVLPYGVQVTSIDPVITKEGDVQIRLRVSGDRDRTIQLVRNLEHSQRFIEPRLAAESQQKDKEKGATGQTTGQVGVQPGVLPVSQPIGNGVEFDILSGYRPLPMTPVREGSRAPKTRTAKPSADQMPTVQPVNPIVVPVHPAAKTMTPPVGGAR